MWLFVFQSSKHHKLIALLACYCLQVQHPAAKMIVMASQQQEQEAGDGTNFVIAFAGALCEQAEELLRMVWLCKYFYL